ncbi:MAG: DNA gyrase subunit A, partial [Planctomycetota bacterium]
TAAASEMLADLKLDTVDYVPNYDERTGMDEPTVLPSKFPNLLVNGSTGIAVGMACNLLPHNLNEICDGIVRVLDRPEIGLGDLMRDEVDEDGNVTKLGIKGPDFPTGGIVMGTDGIIEGYDTGRGRMTLRAKHHLEETKTKTTIVLDELPFGVIRSSIQTAVADAVKAGRISDVAAVNDESGRKHDCRIVIDLKRGAEADVVLQQIWQYTPAQVTVSMINIAIVGRRPRTLGLKALIQNFIAHRRDVIVRRTRHLLKKAQQRGHILEGLIYAVCDIDEVVKLIRGSSTREEAIEKLRLRGFQIPADHPYAPQIPQTLLDKAAAGDEDAGVRLSQTQAEAIGRLQLIQLV